MQSRGWSSTEIRQECQGKATQDSTVQRAVQSSTSTCWHRLVTCESCHTSLVKVCVKQNIGLAQLETNLTAGQNKVPGQRGHMFVYSCCVKTNKTQITEWHVKGCLNLILQRLCTEPRLIMRIHFPDTMDELSDSGLYSWRLIQVMKWSFCGFNKKRSSHSARFSYSVCNKTLLEVSQPDRAQ